MHYHGDHGSHPHGHWEASLMLSSHHWVCLSETLCHTRFRNPHHTQVGYVVTQFWCVSPAQSGCYTAGLISVSRYYHITCVQFQQWLIHALFWVEHTFHCTEPTLSHPVPVSGCTRGRCSRLRGSHSFICFSACSLPSWHWLGRHLTKFSKATALPSE